MWNMSIIVNTHTYDFHSKVKSLCRAPSLSLFLPHEPRPNFYQKSLMMSLIPAVTNLVAHCHSFHSPPLVIPSPSPSPSQSLSVPHRQLPSVVIGFVCAHGGHITQVLCTMHTADIKFGSVSMPMTCWPTKPTPDPRPTTLMVSVPPPLNPYVSQVSRRLWQRRIVQNFIDKCHVYAQRLLLGSVDRLAIVGEGSGSGEWEEGELCVVAGEVNWALRASAH